MTLSETQDRGYFKFAEIHRILLQPPLNGDYGKEITSSKILNATANSILNNTMFNRDVM